ncbi:hypothetical protein BKI52_12300 [marine bacterium AO1-C]|nr:hypothetical protein BKI52_12300 [marine bacterium AO1-C]
MIRGLLHAKFNASRSRESSKYVWHKSHFFTNYAACYTYLQKVRIFVLRQMFNEQSKKLI